MCSFSGSRVAHNLFLVYIFPTGVSAKKQLAVSSAQFFPARALRNPEILQPFLAVTASCK